LQQYSMRDAVRPLILDGFAELERRFGVPVALEHAYAALLTGCVMRGVTLRPAQAPHFEDDLQLFRELLASVPPLSGWWILDALGSVQYCAVRGWQVGSWNGGRGGQALSWCYHVLWFVSAAVARGCRWPACVLKEANNMYRKVLLLAAAKPARQGH
jgi:hypothetical protein